MTVSVQSLDDTLPEESETFVFRLSHTTNAAIAGGTALGTIHDNDLLPNLSVADLYVVEGDDPAAVFVVELDRPGIADVTFDYATVTGTARPGADCDDRTDDTDDYLPVTGNATIPVGNTQTTISVTICDDTVVEDAEEFILRLTNAVEALIVDEFGAVATIPRQRRPAEGHDRRRRSLRGRRHHHLHRHAQPPKRHGRVAGLRHLRRHRHPTRRLHRHRRPPDDPRRRHRGHHHRAPD